jgi:PAS domain S-box-containing protein
MTLTTRLAIAMILLVVIAVTAVGWLSYRSLEQGFLPRVLDRIETHSRLVAADLQSHVRGARADVASFRASAAAHGMVLARLNGGIDPVDHVSEATWRERLLTRLVAELRAKPAYSKFCLIGVEDGQREIVRVDRSGPNGEVRVVPDAELQRKGDRPFFSDALKLRPDEVSVSAIVLNEDNGVIETPHVPILRVATPLAGPDGKPFGVFIIHVDMRPAFDRVRSSVRPGEQIYVVNGQGDYLVHPDPAREFGTQLGTPANWQSDFPYFTAALGAAKGGAQIVPDPAGRPGGAAIAPATLAGKQWVGIIEMVPNTVFMAAAAPIRRNSILVGLIAVLCAAALAVLVANSLTRPINQLTAAVEGLGRSDPVVIPVDSGGETGVLARAFARVIGEANAKTAALEREVREHRLTEAARDHHAAREHVFSAVVESSNDAVVTKSLDGVITGWNPAAERLFGYSANEAVGKNIALIVPPNRISEVHDALRRIGWGETIEHSETVRLRKDGSPVEVSLSISPIKSPSGTIVGASKIARDITESRRTEQTLRRQIEERRRIFETSQDLILVTDTKGILVQVSPSSETILGYLPEEMIGHNASEFLHRDDLERSREAMRAARRGHNMNNADSRYVHKDGRTVTLSWMGRWSEPVRRHFFIGRDMTGSRLAQEEFRAELSVTALRRRGGVVFNGFIRDLTDRIAAEDRIRQAEKMEAVGQLTGGIAHDFNNILTVITGTIEILADAVANEPQLAAITKMIDEAASRGADLTQHLLAFARKQPLQPRETDVNALIIETGKLLRPTLGEQIEIETVFEDEGCFATVDPNQLVTAILNLALNARDAMPGGGKLILETGSAVLDENYAASHGDVRPGRYALIAVSDTGTGIPAGILDKVFSPFFTSKGPGKGTGLGLSMVYGFVKQSAGHIKIYSEEDHGTTIKMYLPPGTGAAPVSEAALAPDIEGGHETILVVEDDKLVRDFVLTQLHSLGYVTLDAANGAEALAIVEAGHEFDLLFTDVIMPGAINGRQLADEMQKSRPGLKVLFTSGYTENAIIHHGRLDSGILLLAKPYRKSDIAMMIRKALAGQL